MIKNLSILLFSAFLAGCITYTYGGKKFDSLEQVLATQKTEIQEELSEIVPLPRPVVERSLVVITPSYEARKNAQKEIDRITGASRSETQWADFEVKVKTLNARFNHTAMMIRKRNIYREVSFYEAPTFTVPEPTVSDSQDALYTSCTYSPDGKKVACQSYSVSKRFGRQVFAADRSSTSHKENNKALLNAVEAFAIRD